MNSALKNSKNSTNNLSKKGTTQMQPDSKVVIKSILKNDFKTKTETPKSYLPDPVLPLRSNKSRVVFNHDKHTVYQTVQQIHHPEIVHRLPLKDLKNRDKQPGHSFPGLTCSSQRSRVEESVFKNWVTDIPKATLNEVLSFSKTDSMCLDPGDVATVRTSSPLESTKPLLPERLEQLESNEKIRNGQSSLKDFMLIVDQTMAEGKVYVCNGPYPCLRTALNQRGWIEQLDPHKFPDHPSLMARVSSGTNKNSNAKDETPPFYQNLDANKIELASALLKGKPANLYFTVKTTEIINLHLKPSQIANHYGKASAITTKVGLTQSLKRLTFFSSKTMDTFYPRCYCLLLAEEKQAFIDDYQFTSCVSFLKHFMHQFNNNLLGKQPKTPMLPPEPHPQPPMQHGDQNTPLEFDKKPVLKKIDLKGPEIQERLTLGNLKAGGEMNVNVEQLGEGVADQMAEQLVSMTTEQQLIQEHQHPLPNPLKPLQRQLKASASNKENTAASTTTAKPMMKHISLKALKFAMKHCRLFLERLSHKDVVLRTGAQESYQEVMRQKEWKNFLEAYKVYVTDQIPLDRSSKDLVLEVKSLLSTLSLHLPQFNMDGCFNVWIIKPGAKSRGRGIQCNSQLAEILETASNMNNCVIQKYIEKPMLIYKVKFDLRQWFLVTDWNPLTLWFYKHSYIRFCSEDYTLKSFHESIHLSNNSVQKNYQLSSSRSAHLPADSMWTSEEFKAYLKKVHYGDLWESKITPAMKDCIIDVLLCTQDVVEDRKGSFELFGADFMLSEDFETWLIEINSSPSMARTTEATSLLVEKVLEDTIKVVVDRLACPSCDTGGFEVVYQQKKVSEKSFLKNNVVKANSIKAIYKTI